LLDFQDEIWAFINLLHSQPKNLKFPTWKVPKGTRKGVLQMPDPGARVRHIWDKIVKVLTYNSARAFGRRKYLCRHKLKGYHSFTQNFRCLSMKMSELEHYENNENYAYLPESGLKVWHQANLRDIVTDTENFCININ